MFCTLSIRTLYNNDVNVLFLAASKLNLIKIPICWIISNFYLKKLEQYLWYCSPFTKRVAF